MADDISKILNEINKKFGDGSARIMDADDSLPIQRISSGSLNLDLALGNGMPLGRTCEFFGPESSGKTSVALFHAAEVQRVVPDRYILFIDLEHAIDPQLVSNYGVDPHRLVISQPDNGEEAFDIAEAFIRTGKFSLVILDSVAAIVPAVEAEESMEKQTMGVTARIMGKALRKLTPICSDQNTTFIFINQERDKIGVMYGSPTTTPGRYAIAS